MSYEHLLWQRPLNVEGVDSVLWIKTDNGAFEGPLMDWQNSHKAKYIKHCKKFDVVACAGGNQGMYPRFFSKMFKTVYTFEPDPLNFHCLVNNCQDDNIIKFQAALGNSHQMVKVIRDSTMTNVGTHTVQTGGIIPQLRLDDIEFNDLDLIQLDIEGYEDEAVKGALNTIEKFKPLITVERNNPGIRSLLVPLGYEEVEVSSADTFYKVP